MLFFYHLIYYNKNRRIISELSKFSNYVYSFHIEHKTKEIFEKQRGDRKMYSMWLDSKKDVYQYLRNKETDDGKKCFPFAFNINGRIGVTKFKIEELDSLTSFFQNEQDFLAELLDYGDTYIKTSPKNHIIITYHKENIISSSPVIYNDRLIYFKSSEIRRKKKTTKEKVLLEKDVLLRDFIDFMKRLARNKVSRRYLLSPDTLGDDVSYSDKKALKKLVKDDVRKYLGEVNGEARYQMIEKGIRSLLKDYARSHELLEYQRKMGLSTLHVQQELEQVETEIELYFRRDYRNLRMMVAFENQYLEVLEKSIKHDDSSVNRVLLSPLITEVLLQKEVRNGVLDRRALEEYYMSLENPIVPEEPDFIKYEEVRELLKEGGISAVMEQLDADQLYGIYLSDAERLGITKQKKRE